MNVRRHPLSSTARRSAGFGMLEVLISIVLVTIGLLGLAGLQARAITAEFESYQRGQAVMLASDMVDRIRMNRANYGVFKNISDPATGHGYVGTSGADSYALSCGTPANQAIADLCEWSQLLTGNAETQGTNNLGAMIGARGCIFYDVTTEIPGIADSGVFTVAVTWQGTQAISAPSTKCANGLYNADGLDDMRHLVSQSFRLARLN